MQAQRACLDLAIDLVRGLDGPVLEFGLGNGRTYDHLREHLPGRDIFVFERKVAAHPDCIPPERCLFLGDVRETLPTAARRIGRPAVLAHCDIGTGDKRLSLELAALLAPALAGLLMPGAVVVSDQPMEIPGAGPLALPEGVKEGRYFLYRMGAGGA